MCVCVFFFLFSHSLFSEIDRENHGTLRFIPVDDMKLSNDTAEVESSARLLLYNYIMATPNHVKAHELSERLASDLSDKKSRSSQLFTKTLFECINNYLTASKIAWRMEDFEESDSFSQAEVVDLVPELAKVQESPVKLSKKPVATKHVKKSRKRESGEDLAPPPQLGMMPLPPGITISTKPRDIVLQLVDAVDDKFHSAWMSSGEAGQRDIIEKAAQMVKEMREESRLMKEKVCKIVQILDDESRHSEFYEEMLKLAEIAADKFAEP